MKNQSYYRIPDDYSCNFEVKDRPLLVNCTGICVLREPFQNCNPTGRKDCYLMYLYQGSLEAEVDGQTIHLQEGDLILYPAGAPYSYQKTGTDEMIYFWVHFSGSSVEKILSEIRLEQGKKFHPGKSEEFVTCFEQLFQFFYLHQPFFELEAAAQLMLLLTKIAGHILCRNEQNVQPSASRLRHSLEYLYRNYAEPVQLGELAALEHLSPSRYSAVFRKCMGMSPQKFLIMLRINNAADLICRTDLAVKQVAQAVGYDDPFYFSVLFKRKVGVSPSEYRQLQRGSRYKQTIND